MISHGHVKFPGATTLVALNRCVSYPTNGMPNAPRF